MALRARVLAADGIIDDPVSTRILELLAKHLLASFEPVHLLSESNVVAITDGVPQVRSSRQITFEPCRAVSIRSREVHRLGGSIGAGSLLGIPGSTLLATEIA